MTNEVSIIGIKGPEVKLFHYEYLQYAIQLLSSVYDHRVFHPTASVNISSVPFNRSARGERKCRKLEENRWCNSILSVHLEPLTEQNKWDTEGFVCVSVCVLEKERER